MLNKIREERIKIEIKSLIELILLMGISLIVPILFGLSLSFGLYLVAMTIYACILRYSTDRIIGNFKVAEIWERNNVTHIILDNEQEIVLDGLYNIKQMDNVSIGVNINEGYLALGKRDKIKIRGTSWLEWGR